MLDLEQIWSRLKQWRRWRLGRIAILFKFERSVRVTAGVLQRKSSQATLGFQRSHQAGFAEFLGAAPSQSAHTNQTHPGTAVIVGVGPGFGFALARRLVNEGFDVVLVSRNAGYLDPLLEELRKTGRRATSYGADATDEHAVGELFSAISAYCGTPSLVVYSLQDTGPGSTVDIELPAFESAWRHNCLGAFLVSRAAARSMKVRGEGSILLIGSTSSMLGRAGHLNLAVGKFGQRALSQVLAREMWPFGVHVAHIVIDADIAESQDGQIAATQSRPDDIAFSVLAIHRQPKTAWTSEIDLRPWNEKFWEHC
jgi:NAD(P)-dependent dehydrogenase (short-subunit alcohol dehydrogenase family)